MSGAVEENAVAALEALYSGPMQGRELAQAREIFAYLRSNGQVSRLARTRSRGCMIRTSCLPCACSSSSRSALFACRVR